MTPMPSSPSLFFGCYLLTPVFAPQRLRCTYVGFTVSPTRRIRQHNGEIRNGAKRTAKHRPWEMVAVVHGFPSKFHALQFEYAWQHPYNCRLTKERLCKLKGKAGVGPPRSLKRKLIELHEIVQLQPWSHFPLAISYISEFTHSVARTSGFYAFPQHMRCETKALEEFKSVGNRRSAILEDDDDENGEAAVETESTERCCFVCEEDLNTGDCDAAAAPTPTGSFRLSHLQCYHEDCEMQCHTLCLADHFLTSLSITSGSEDEPRGDMAHSRDDRQQQEQALLRPERGTCPNCQGELLWPLLVRPASPRRRDRTAKHACTNSNRRNTKRRKRNDGAGENGIEPLASAAERVGTIGYSRVTVGKEPHGDVQRAAAPDNGRSRDQQATSLPTVDHLAYNDDTWFKSDSEDHFGDDGEDVDHYHTPSVGSHEANNVVIEANISDERASAAIIDLTLDDE